MSRDEPSSPLGCFLKVGGVLLALAAVPASVGFWFYGLDSSHRDRESIWDERTRGLTPHAATDITLQLDLLDHYATYRVTEADLNAFLDVHFAFRGKGFDSYSEREPVRPELVGEPIGRLDWTVPEGTVVYSFAAPNGGLSTYYHDPATGWTYQESAHW